MSRPGRRIPALGRTILVALALVVTACSPERPRVERELNLILSQPSTDTALVGAWVRVGPIPVSRGFLAFSEDGRMFLGSKRGGAFFRYTVDTSADPSVVEFRDPSSGAVVVRGPFRRSGDTLRARLKLAPGPAVEWDAARVAIYERRKVPAGVSFTPDGAMWRRPEAR